MSRVPYRLRAPPQVIALISGLHPQIKKKVRAALEAILSKPHAGKALKDELAGLRSFRIGRFRIVYRIAASRVIDLVAIGPRERIYEATYRLIVKEPDYRDCAKDIIATIERQFCQRKACHCINKYICAIGY